MPSHTHAPVSDALATFCVHLLPLLQVDYTNNTEDGQVSVELTGWVRPSRMPLLQQVVPCGTRCIVPGCARCACCGGTQKGTARLARHW